MTFQLGSSKFFMGIQRKLSGNQCQWIRKSVRKGYYTTLVPTPPKVMDGKNIKTIIEKYENILVDCDGVLWNVDHYTKFNGISQSIEKLRQHGKNIFFVTNNSMHARQSYINKFKKLCNFDADEKHVFAVSYVAAQYLKSILSSKAKCYVIGNKGMEIELQDANIENIGFGPDTDKLSDHIDDLVKHEIEDNVAAVLVGFDHHFSYNKLFKATSYLNNPNCHYVATNDKEMAVSLSPKHKQPVTGAIVAAVSAACKRPPVVIGKPNKHLWTCLLQENPNLDSQKTLMIGDSQASDIQFAHRCDIDSALVLTGASTLESVKAAVQNGNTELIPKYLLPKFSDFNKYL